MHTIAITGANRGIGHATARLLSSQGHRVVLVCRDGDRGREALASLTPLPTGARHHLVVADLASLGSVREGARQILELGLPLAALVNNAAVLPARRVLSHDGFEIQLAVTHLGHFLLTHQLLPLLERHEGKSRVVTVSSAAHAGPPLDFDDLNFEARPYRRTRAYQQSKLANVLFTLALARRLAERRAEGAGVEAVALHPGIYDTGLLRDYMGAIPGSGAVAGVFAGDAGKAAPILAEIAAGRRSENLGGAYLDKGAVDRPSKAARDSEAQERLWEWSARAVGIAVDAGPGRSGRRG